MKFMYFLVGYRKYDTPPLNKVGVTKDKVNLKNNLK